MKKLLVILLALVTTLSTLAAYELNGKVDVKWTGFKTEKKSPVSGTFKDIKVTSQKAESLVELLKQTKVEIDALSFDSKNPFRDKNITTTLFALPSSKTIKGEVVTIDESTNDLVLRLTMNEITKTIFMHYEIKDSKIHAKGTIDVLNFAMRESFLAFAKKCAALHQNKSFSDVDIEFTLPFK